MGKYQHSEMALDPSKDALDSFITQKSGSVCREGGEKKMKSALFSPTKIYVYVAIRATDYASNFRKISV